MTSLSVTQFETRRRLLENERELVLTRRRAATKAVTPPRRPLRAVRGAAASV